MGGGALETGLMQILSRLMRVYGLGSKYSALWFISCGQGPQDGLATLCQVGPLAQVVLG